MKLRYLVFASTTIALSSLAQETLRYNEHIRPILADKCFACHGHDAAHRKAKLRLDVRGEAVADREGIPAIVPGDVARSELWRRIDHEDPAEAMPPADSNKPRLDAGQRALIRRWIDEGAAYEEHWAFQPVSRPAVPPESAPSGAHPIDRLVAASLAAHRRQLSPEASQAALLRRVTLDLTGLPPTMAELDAYLADQAPGAYERLVNRLLGSPAFGEHFARYWLDAVRYADTNGLHLDNIRNIWPYRDWVVGAFNRNLPFDQFTIEQLAGDLLPAPRIDQLVASGYNRNHLTTSEAGAIEAEVDARNTADRVNTTAAVWLGLTAGCAQCHDHKFDPLSQREYYAFGAFFKGLADRVWDGNIPKAGPLVLIAGEEQQRRIKHIAGQLPALATALSARAEQFAKITIESNEEEPAAPLADDNGSPQPPTMPPGKRAAYEVVWAEDGDMPYASEFGQPQPAGEWREGAGVPLVGGRRALRLEGPVERRVNFGGGEVLLMVRTSARAFVHFQPDPVRPPRAISLEFVSEEKSHRVVWGDPAAFGPAAVNAIVAGPMPAAGGYVRIEIDAGETGIAENKSYRGLRLAQSDGIGWWDRIGVACVSPDAATDPLLSPRAWAAQMRPRARSVEGVPLPHAMVYLVAISPALYAGSDQEVLARFHRDYILGPIRGAIEPEAMAARHLLAEQVHYESTLPAAPISRETDSPREAHVLKRGQYDSPGEPVGPATPAFLPLLEPAAERPTRLDLARWLVDPRNPLTARVAVNRFWQQLFGAGLVRTPGDFGTQGEPPTHPELLDWLAAEFVQTGWDVKRLVRLLVTSRTYRQDSHAAPGLRTLDPDNRLLARASRFRLDAEVLRDQALALGGLLRPETGGPPVRPYQPINIWEPVAFGGSNTKVYVQDHGNALYRRSLYTFWKRTAPAPSMAIFDAPSREFSCVVRDRSNTPMQALALMNDVQHMEAARAFAARLLTRGEDEAGRLTHAFRSATSRAPEAAERRLLQDTLAIHRTHFAAHPELARKLLANGESAVPSDLPAVELAAWTMIANLLLNLDETVTRD